MMNKKQPLEILKTNDGSFTLVNTEMDETYHSRHGALTESEHVFIKSGLEYWMHQNGQKQISILEVGFGTGLNALLTYEWALQNDKPVQFTTTEPYPIASSLLQEYATNSDWKNARRERFLSLHGAPWNVVVELNENYLFTKKDSGILECSGLHPVDVVYFDAFAPAKDAVVWKVDVLAHLHSQMEAGGVLVCYSSQGQFRRNLQQVGFEVEKIPGPPGKREMIRAIKA